MRHSRSIHNFSKAKKLLVGGVNSPVRAFKAVGTTPVFMKRGRGSRITDADGNTYIDYVMSWGALILGHRFPSVAAAARRALENGSSFGAPTEGETQLAREIARAIPSMRKVRLVSSGTEAAMSAIRLARGYTGREKIIKFDGCYHGHSDSLLIKAGSGGATFGIPDSAGVPASLARQTIVLPYNDPAALERRLARDGERVACIIVEPVAANMGVVTPQPGYLRTVRSLASTYGIVLIFDEVITGFRLKYGGAQDIFGVTPDLTCLGKIIGGGFPLAAFGGSARIMDRLAPLGDVYQAGTLSGNPCAVAAGLATLKELSRRDYAALDQKAARLCGAMGAACERQGMPLRVNRCGSLFTPFFTGRVVRDYASARLSDTRAYAAFFRSMLNKGISLAPSQFEAGFVSFSHTGADIERTIAAFTRTMKEVG